MESDERGHWSSRRELVHRSWTVKLSNQSELGIDICTYPWLNWIWRSCNILFLLVFWNRLRRFSLDRRRFTEICIWNGQCRILDGFHEFLIDIFNDNLIARGGICDSLSFGRGRLILVRRDFVSLCFIALVNLVVSLCLVFVETLNELFDIWNRVGPRPGLSSFLLLRHSGVRG